MYESPTKSIPHPKGCTPSGVCVPSCSYNVIQGYKNASLNLLPHLFAMSNLAIYETSSFTLSVKIMGGDWDICICFGVENPSPT